MDPVGSGAGGGDDEDGFGLVEIEHEARTHTNELSILGSGTVRLPKRGL